jgi:glucan 1,3-beta-glucosidase
MSLDFIFPLKHEYQIFSDLELDRSFDDHINVRVYSGSCSVRILTRITSTSPRQFACGYIQSLGAYQSGNIWTIIGEWSNAPTDCAQWLNGRGVGARWDGTWFPGPTSVVHGPCGNYTGSFTGWTDDYKMFLRK